MPIMPRARDRPARARVLHLECRSGAAALIGSVTRAHNDIDIPSCRVDYDAIKAAPLDAGWQHTPVPDEVVGTRYESDSAVQVEFTPVVADETGAS